jgi:hypothetical protein
MIELVFAGKITLCSADPPSSGVDKGFLALTNRNVGVPVPDSNFRVE